MKERRRPEHWDERRAFAMCWRKKKFKSAKANKVAHKMNQRKYQCPLCEHWHLTKKRKGYE